jgi:hypothetical protein
VLKMETAGSTGMFVETELALSKGPNRVGVFPPHLRMETDPVSETLCFLVTGRWTKSKNPVILYIVHNHQNPSESTKDNILGHLIVRYC